jgi:hypothetical protein
MEKKEVSVLPHPIVIQVVRRQEQQPMKEE